MLTADTTISAKILKGLLQQSLERRERTGIMENQPKRQSPPKKRHSHKIQLERNQPLSVRSKIVCMVLLQRIKGSVYKKLKGEQAGFRKGDHVQTKYSSREHTWNESLHST